MLYHLLAINQSYFEKTCRQFPCCGNLIKNSLVRPAFSGVQVSLSIFAAFLLLLVIGLVTGAKDRKADRPSDPAGPVKPEPGQKHRRIVQAAIVVTAVLLIAAGILNGSAGDVLVKAIHICTECIGLG